MTLSLRPSLGHVCCRMKAKILQSVPQYLIGDADVQASPVMGGHIGQSIANREKANESQEQVHAVGKTQELKKQQAIPIDCKKFW